MLTTRLSRVARCTTTTAHLLRTPACFAPCVFKSGTSACGASRKASRFSQFEQRRASSRGAVMATASKTEAADVVQRQVVLYNKRELEPFMGLMADDVHVSDTVTGKVLATSAAELRPRYVERFKTPVKAEVLGRLLLGPVVVDREFITGLPGDTMADCLATYVVDGEHLKRISFVWRQRDGSTQMDKKAVAVVEEQLVQYNNHSVEGFMKLVHENVQVFDGLTGKLIADGAAALRPRYEARFAPDPATGAPCAVHCELLGRLVCGCTVVDRELITGLPGGGVADCLATYVVDEASGLISRIYFVWQPRTEGVKL